MLASCGHWRGTLGGAFSPSLARWQQQCTSTTGSLPLPGSRRQRTCGCPQAPPEWSMTERGGGSRSTGGWLLPYTNAIVSENRE
jgi:hypothetical protein